MSSVRGLHWGNVEFDSNNLSMQVNDRGVTKNLFKIPLKKINNSTVQKNVVIVQVNADDAQGDEDMLCQVRLFIEPGKSEIKANEEGGEAIENREMADVAQTLNKEIVQKAKIGESAGESIVTLNDISLVVPRGKYTIDFAQKNLRFHGPTFNYNIDYKNIQRGFILPLSNEAQTAIVLQLAKPIHQGQTIHPFIVVQVRKEVQVNIKTRVKPEYLKQSPHLEAIKAEYNGELEQILAELLRSIVKIDLIVPGGHFKSTQGGPYVKCSLKTQTGWLYFLKKSMIFITKPVIYFRVPDIERVEFHRLGGTNKLFDMKIMLKGQGGHGQTSQFVGIQRIQYQAITEYFKQREVPYTKVGDGDKKSHKIDVEDEDDDDEEEDEDFDANVHEDDDGDDDASVSLSKEK